MRFSLQQNYRVLPRRNLEATGAVGANLRPFSFVGSVRPLHWSPNLAKPLYREKTVYITPHKTAINRPVDHTGET